MKHQQVVPDYWAMLKTSLTFLVLAAFGFILLRMVHAIFWLPTALKRNQENVRRKLEAYEAKFKEYECSQEEDNKDEKEPDRIQASTTVTGETASTSSASITAAEPKKEL